MSEVMNRDAGEVLGISVSGKLLFWKARQFLPMMALNTRATGPECCTSSPPRCKLPLAI